MKIKTTTPKLDYHRNLAYIIASSFLAGLLSVQAYSGTKEHDSETIKGLRPALILDNSQLEFPRNLRLSELDLGISDMYLDPAHGMVFQGKGTFLSDFVIDCDGLYFARVSYNGGERYENRRAYRENVSGLHKESHDGIDISIRNNNFLCYQERKGNKKLEAIIIYTGFNCEKAEVIEARESKNGMGLYMVLGREINGKYVETLFGHLKQIGKKNGQTLKKRDIVEPGDEIGIVGKSGEVTAPHLHYGYSLDGNQERLLRIK